jgi:hypothetical protein
LTQDSRVNKLYLAILQKNIQLVKNALNAIDPKDHKHRAYFMAVNEGVKEIIDMIEENIIERNLLEERAIETMIQSQIGTTNVPRELYRQTRGRF